MNDTTPEKPEEHILPLSVGDPRSAQVTINKVAEGFHMTFSLKEGGRTRAASECTVATYAEAETVARTFASQLDFPWFKVAVVSQKTGDSQSC